MKLTFKGKVQKLTKTEAGSTFRQTVLVKNEKNTHAIEFYGDRVDQLNDVQDGQQVEVTAFLNSKQWKGRWFTNVNGSEITITKWNGTSSDDLPENLPF